jgi:hypothetical protein
LILLLPLFFYLVSLQLVILWQLSYSPCFSLFSPALTSRNQLV